MNSAHTRARGSALLITLTLIVLSSTLVAVLVQLMTRSSMTTQDNLRGMQALYMAESGLEVARATVGGSLATTSCTPRQTRPDIALTTVSVGGVVQGEYQSSMTYVPGDHTIPPTWTLGSNGYAPSLADLRGRRNLTWSNVRCTASYAPLYTGNVDLSSFSGITISDGTDNRSKWRDTKEDCTQCNAVDENAVNVDATYTSFPVFVPFPDFSGWSDLSAPPDVDISLSPQIKMLDITGNATINMSAGDYYVEFLKVESGVTATFQILSGPVRLHVNRFTMAGNTSSVGINASGQPIDFTLFYNSNLDWRGTFDMKGVILGAPGTTAQIATSVFTLNGGLLTQGAITLSGPMTIIDDDPAMAAVTNIMGSPAPVRMSAGTLTEN